jgi:hypothetical protein
MDPITIAMGLAQFAPQLVKWITGSDNAAAGAQKVVDIASAVTGQSDPAAALAALQADKQLQMQFQQSVMANETNLVKAFLADTQSARQRDVALAQSGVRNYRATSLVAAAMAIVVVCLAVVIWQSDLNEFAKGAVTLILGRALGWIEQVFSFEFGTTRNSAVQQQTINNLSK